MLSKGVPKRAGHQPAFWLSDIGARPNTAPLPGDTQADVCIVGAGLTGLWTAYYLKQAVPDADIVVLEKEFAGYGASGRNGGWLTSEFNGKLADIEERGGSGSVAALHEAMCATVEEVVDVCRAEEIDAEIVRGGALRLAQCPAQSTRLRDALDKRRQYGASAGYLWLTEAEIRERVRIPQVLGGAFNEVGARLHPAKLVAGLSAVIQRMGVRLHEGTAVTDLRSKLVVTPRGNVQAEVVLSCLEAYTRDLPGQQRALLPLHSSAIVTEPLPAAAWEEIGWSNRELLANGATAFWAAQRTQDDRIVLGAKGAMPRYRIGSRLDRGGATTKVAVRVLREELDANFPAAKDAALADAWCGVLGVPRDWSPTVRFDRRTGVGWAGGYVGSGVSTANLAGRTLTDLVRGTASDLTKLAWVGHTTRPWEPEPLRWLGVRSMSALFAAADRRETSLQRPSKLSALGARITGR